MGPYIGREDIRSGSIISETITGIISERIKRECINTEGISIESIISDRIIRESVISKRFSFYTLTS